MNEKSVLHKCCQQFWSGCTNRVFSITPLFYNVTKGLHILVSTVFSRTSAPSLAQNHVVFSNPFHFSWKRQSKYSKNIIFFHTFVNDTSIVSGTGGCTQMLLITDYHQNGSLYDYLKYDEIDEEQMVSFWQKIVV